MREEAQELMKRAEQLFYLELGLPRLHEDDGEYFIGETGKIVKAFITKASELDLRLDASYHMPIIKFLIKQLNNSLNGYSTDLGNVVEYLFRLVLKGST